MTKLRALPEIVGDIYALLDPLGSEDRQKVVKSAMLLLGEEATTTEMDSTKNNSSVTNSDNDFGVKANRWMKQNGVAVSGIEELFHRDGDQVEVIASEIPGNGKKVKSRNCYLLSGIRSLMESDEPKFTESDAVALCKHMGCHDSANHAKTRGDLGNTVAGTKTTGFTLSQPGLRAAAELIKSMASDR